MLVGYENRLLIGSFRLLLAQVDGYDSLRPLGVLKTPQRVLVRVSFGAELQHDVVDTFCFVPTSGRNPAELQVVHPELPRWNDHQEKPNASLRTWHLKLGLLL